MQLEDEEWVSHTLMEYERKRCISKILSMNNNGAVEKGNNFVCDVKKLKLKVVLNSGDVVERPVVFKTLPKTKIRRSFFRGANIHVKESRVYTEVLPEIEKIRLEKNNAADRITPICYGVQPKHEGLLMEDLTSYGFQMVDRRKGLDFAHAELTIKALAEFHAAGKILIDQGDVNMKEFSENVHRDNADTNEKMNSKTLKNVISNIENLGEEWIEYADRVRELTKSYTPLMVKSLTLEDNNFNTIIHGDLWLTNMMYQYNSEGQPRAIRLLDFQLSHYNNVGIDLRHFFNSSLDMQTFSRKQELLKIYYEKLITSLDLYGFLGKVPTYEELLECYDRARFWGLLVGLLFRPMVMQPQEQVPDDLEEFLKNVSENNERDIPPFLEDVQEVLKCLLKSAVDEGIL